MDELPVIRSEADFRAIKLALLRARGDLIEMQLKLGQVATLLDRARAIVGEVESSRETGRETNHGAR